LAMKGLANVPAAANPAVPQSTERLPSLLIVCLPGYSVSRISFASMRSGVSNPSVNQP
jgi:hypothetical protein